MSSLLRLAAPTLFAALLTSVAAAPAEAQGPSATETIDVIGTPLGSTVDAARIAANVQIASSDELREQGALDLTDFMNRSLASVFVNHAQNNPLQPDLQYRGFVGSPLLGLPQGLAVYQDGVRINEPFGDTVNWALLPDSAVATLYLLPGSNPLFGLNALGGTIAVATKDGFDHAGSGAELFAGSFGRVGLQAETGGTFGENLAYFVTAEHLDEDGWRAFSPTEATQLFAKLSSRSDTTRVDVSLSLAETDLVGNGATPIDLLELDREAIFTRPDQTRNGLSMLTVSAEQRVSPRVVLTGNLYVRSSRVRTLNGDDSDFEECEDTPGFICEEDDGEEEIVLDADDEPIPADETLEGATVNRTTTNQDSGGFGFQARFGDGTAHSLIVGLVHDTSSVDFAASTELGALDATRRAVPGGVFVGEAFTGLQTSSKTTGVYVTSLWDATERLTLTLAGRYNRTQVVLEDQLGDELDGRHSFDRFNPAVGLTADLGSALGWYASYGESSRAPSPVELTCADEDDPCRLPNAFVADPPLEQVVAKTFETGLRGRLPGGRWHAGLFRTSNDDDILFISAGALTSEGYFDNVGKTRRDGIEINLSGDVGERFGWSFDYTLLDATFRERFAVPSPNNPAAVDGEIAVGPGDRLPLIPERLVKVGVRLAASSALVIGAEVVAASGQHYRGDEGNLLEKIDGYAVVNLHGEYRFNERASVFASIDNVLDEEYDTFGVFGEADEVLGEDFEDPRFLGPGAPRAVFLGVRVRF